MEKISRLLRKTPRIFWALAALLVLCYLFSLPRPLFDEPFSTVLEDARGGLLGARIAADEQWRFPTPDSVPYKYEQALVQFEDKRFHRHIGVDIASMARAMRQNLAARRVVSGGSTISMQVIRLARKPASRSIFQKTIEIILATRLELGYSKKDILRLYASHAPYGGNVVGLEAASWRYFGKQPHLLSWGEAATLAVLPNSPGIIHPGKNRAKLLEKRNRLLDRLRDRGILDQLSCALAKEEALPESPLPIPQLAPHLLERLRKKNPSSGMRFQTAVDPNLQRQLAQVLNRHIIRLKSNEIHNAAALVLDTNTGDILAYVGNVVGTGAEHGEKVDVITARRSTGSILKPFLYALALQEGIITPYSLLPDIPTSIRGYRPENFSSKYDGVVTARQALIRSLNIPMVVLLQRYGQEKFHFQLPRLGLRTFTRPASHYGLSIILGGGECTLEEVTQAYAAMARTLNEYPRESASPLSASACWLTLETLRQLDRPDELGQWERFQSSQSIAWKTGTSFGFRDAWAVGVTPQYTVGVWVGNADGEGRPGLVGVRAAAPILFDIFEQVPGKGEWFQAPYDNMRRVEVCRQSGYRPLPICPTDTIWLSKTGMEGPLCPYHHIIHLDPQQRYQVSAACELPDKMVHRPWFTLPPLEEHFYVQLHPEYKTLPPFRDDCDQAEDKVPMQLIDPKPDVRIYIPLNLDGSLSRTVFKAAHRRSDAVIYWHIDDLYVGKTEQFHHLEIVPPEGTHILTLVDDKGARLERRFTILPGKNTPTSLSGRNGI